MSFSTFQLDLPPLREALQTTAATVPPTRADALSEAIKPVSDTSDFDNRGSFDYDQENGYTLKWDNLVKFKEWLEYETESKTIELVRKEIRRNPNQSTSNHWIEKHIYVCGRGFSGGKKKYERKHTWTRKVPIKRTGCTCRLTIKTYPERDTILGNYNDAHSHDIGNKNARFTRLPKSTRKEIERLLRLGVDPKKVLEQIQGGVYTEQNTQNLQSGEARRSEFTTRADIRRIEKIIEQETIRLASQDGASVLAWVKKLREQGHFVEIKSSSDTPPANSGLDRDSFVFIIQTQYQRECWQKHAHRYAGIDATHNTTHYENMSLFTLLVRDKWGHGMPAGWMISSNGTEETISFFLKTLHAQNAGVCPEYFMSDKDHAQMNAIRRIYPKSTVLLCWWHVLHAWQQHFVTTHFPELWGLLKGWIRITDAEKFQLCWAEIQQIAPPSFTQYIQTYWLNDTKLWSAVYRRDRNIFQNCDTNMLVEAWHHLLKGNFLQGKRNRRLDHLLHVLVMVAVPYFIQRHRRQAFGFEGPDLEARKRIDIERLAKTIPLSDITQEIDETFLVQSQTMHDVRYRVDLQTYDCECVSFPTICFCKHICAVQTHFPDDDCRLVPTSMLTINCADSFDAEISSSDSGDESETSQPREQREPPVTLKNIVNTLSSLAIRLQVNPPPTTPNSLLELHGRVKELVAELDRSDIALLPPKKEVAPNQHSWSETAAVMNVRVKSKRKAHLDPYGGGERPGKKAKPDARSPALQPGGPPVSLAARTSVLSMPLLRPEPCVALVAQASTLPMPLAQEASTFSVPGQCGASSTPDMLLSLPRLPNFNVGFNPAIFDLRNKFALNCLKRAQLNQLCSYYKLKANGTNEAVISRLEACISSPVPILSSGS